MHVSFNRLAFGDFGSRFWRFQDDRAADTAVDHHARRRGMQGRRLVHNINRLPALILLVQKLEAGGRLAELLDAQLFLPRAHF